MGVPCSMPFFLSGTRRPQQTSTPERSVFLRCVPSFTDRLSCWWCSLAPIETTKYMQRPPLSRPFQCCRMTCLQELKEDVRKFRKEWEVSGPMVQGISPLEAVERLRRFKEEMQLRERKVGCSWRVILVSGCCVAVSSRVSGVSLPSHTCARWPHWSTLLRRCTPYLCSRYLGDKPFPRREAS